MTLIDLTMGVDSPRGLEWTPELQERLRDIASRTGPEDQRPTLIVEQGVYYDGAAYQCLVSLVDGGSIAAGTAWEGLGRTEREAFNEAMEKYWSRVK